MIFDSNLLTVLVFNLFIIIYEALPEQAKSKDKDDEKKDESPKLIIPDVMLVVRPSRVSEDTQKLILEHMDFGNPVIFMVDPLPVFPFVMLGSEPGNVFETPTRKLASSPFGYQPENEPNNNVNTIFDALKPNDPIALDGRRRLSSMHARRRHEHSLSPSPCGYA